MKNSNLKLTLLTGLASIVCALGLHAADLTWDADNVTPGVQDGTNVWDTVTNTWWDGANNVTWDNATPANAIFGGGTAGTAGPVIVGPSLTINVGNLTFNAPFSGNYNLTPGDANSRLSFIPSSVVTVASGLTVTNTVVLTGSSSFTKAGPGTFSLRPGAANANSGTTIVTAGTLVMGSAPNRVVIPGDLIVTNTGVARLGTSGTITNTATVSVATGATFDMNGANQTVPFFFLNGGTVNQNAGTLTANTFILNGGTESQTSTESLVVNNFDARSGSISQSGGTGKLDCGTLTKSTSGTVTLTSRGSSATGGGITNTIVNDGTLILDYTQNSSKLNDNSGTLTVNGGSLVFANGSHSEALTTVTLTGGVITNASGTSKLTLATGSYDVRAGAVYTVLAGAASLTKTTPGTVVLANAQTYTGGTLISDGVLQIGDGVTSGSVSTTGGALVTNNSVLVLNPSPTGASFGNTITGTGSVIKIGSGTNSFTGANTYSGSTTISNGAINLNSSATLGDGTSALNLSGGTLTTTASRTASSAPISNAVNVTADSAITTTSTSSTVDLNFISDSIGGSAGTLTFSNAAGSGTGVFQPRFTGSSFNFGRPIVIANGSFGTARMDSYNTNGTSQTFSGVISGNGGYRRNASTASLAGTTVFSANNTYTGLTEVNRGTLLVNGSLVAASSVSVGGSGNLGTLGGNGTIKGPVSVLVNGTLSPGASIGILTISNSLTFAAGSTCFMELNKSTPTNDLVRGISTVNYAGTLVVANLSGTLALNDTFKLFDATTYAGSFSATNLPALDPGLAWDTTGLTNNGTIKVVTATVTSPILNVSQSGNTLTFSWTGAFKLQSQTNGLSVGLFTNWVDYPDLSNPVGVTIDPASPSVFFRLSQ